MSQPAAIEDELDIPDPKIGAVPENVTSIQRAEADTAGRPAPSPPSKPEAMADEHQRAD